MMNKTIEEIERHHVRYLIWSNRNYEEYMAFRFSGRIDQDVGDYFRSHYHRISSLPGAGDWRADIWERTAEGSVR